MGRRWEEREEGSERQREVRNEEETLQSFPSLLFSNDAARLRRRHDGQNRDFSLIFAPGMDFNSSSLFRPVFRDVGLIKLEVEMPLDALNMSRADAHECGNYSNNGNASECNQTVGPVSGTSAGKTK
ncbi:hypothetical protein WMY93_033791, partial [Mugilogobius chulae]